MLTPDLQQQQARSLCTVRGHIFARRCEVRVQPAASVCWHTTGIPRARSRIFALFSSCVVLHKTLCEVCQPPFARGFCYEQRFCTQARYQLRFWHCLAFVGASYAVVRVLSNAHNACRRVAAPYGSLIFLKDPVIYLYRSRNDDQPQTKHSPSAKEA